MKVKIYTLYALICLPFYLKAQVQAGSANEQKTLRASGISSAIKIDGLLNETAWNTADSAAGFIQVEPNQGSLAKFQTVVKVVYNESSLYVAAICYDSSGKKGIRVTELYRDFNVSKNDVFSFCIDAFNDKRNNMTFAANPYGAQHDYLSFDAQLTDVDWNGLWKVRTAIHDDGWVAEFEIPWKTLRYKGIDSQQLWGINFYRQRRSGNETSAWSPYPRSFSFNRMEFAGALSALSPPAPSANVQVNPYMLGVRSYDESGGMSKTNHETKAGGEIKWAINSNAVLDLTVSTDFAQANADIAVNNITRFSVLFPERRQFFLENASLFGPGLNGTGGSMYIYPFFSRTIGLDNAMPVAIHCGARFVNRSPRQNFGALVIQQAGDDSSPLTHFAVARYSRNFSSQARVGGLVSVKAVARNDAESSHTNMAATLDGFFRLDKNNALSVMAIRSSDSHSQEGGVAAYLQYLFTTNAIQAWYTQSVITKDYQNDMGFVSRRDIITTSPGFITNLRGKWLPFKRWLRAVQPDVAAEFYHQASTGKLIESTIAIYPVWFLLHSGGFFGYSLTPTYQYLADVFTPLGVTISPGVYRYNRSTFYFSSDPSKKISYSLVYDIGSYFDGGLVSTTGSLALSPIPHILVKLSLSDNAFKTIGMEEHSAEIRLYTMEGRFAVNPRLQLNGLLQHNTQNKITSFYARLSWEYRPLSYLFFVFNNKQTGTDERLLERDAILKLSYLKQF